MRRYERIGRVQTSPDNDTDVRVDEKFDHEEVSEICLCFAGEGAEDACRTSVEDCAFSCCDSCGRVGDYLFMILAIDEKTGHEGTEDLGEDVVGNLFPGKALPSCKADRHGWIEVTVTMLD